MSNYCTGVGIVIDKATNFHEYKSLLNDQPLNETTLYSKRMTYVQFKNSIEHAFLESILDAGICLAELENNERIGLVIGSSLGFVEYSNDLNKNTMDFSWLIRKYRFKGLVYVVSNTCVSSMSAVSIAINLLNTKNIDTCIVGGVDVAGDFINNGFKSMNLLNKQNFIHLFKEKDDGTFLSNASCFLVISKHRKNKCYLEILASSITNDAYDLCRIEKDGKGLYKAVCNCLQTSNISAKQVDVIMTCANGVYKLDSQQCRFIKQHFGGIINVSTVKNLIGHTLGASSLIDIVSIIAFKENKKIHTIYDEWYYQDLNYVLVMSVGFAGVNGAVLLYLENE